jgi:hypothetical protein
MTSLRRLRVPSILLLALVAALAFAATAAAETKIGEGTSPENPAITKGEADLLGASASYVPSTGAVSFSFTTRQAPESTPVAERPEVSYMGALITTNIPCTTAAFEAELGGGGSGPPPVFPILEVETSNKYSETGPAVWFAANSEKEIDSESGPSMYGVASKTVSGSTVTGTAASTTAVNGPYNCVLTEAADYNESQTDLLVFPLTTKPEPPAVVAPPAPTPTAAFSLAPIKTLKAKEGKWTKVNVKVTNTGNAAAGPIAIQAKAPKGVVLQPGSGSIKLPALLAGQSWTVTFRAKLTSKAKKSSKIALTTSSGAISATGSFLLKLAG